MNKTHIVVMVKQRASCLFNCRSYLFSARRVTANRAALLIAIVSAMAMVIGHAFGQVPVGRPNFSETVGNHRFIGWTNVNSISGGWPVGVINDGTNRYYGLLELINTNPPLSIVNFPNTNNALQINQIVISNSVAVLTINCPEYPGTDCGAWNPFRTVWLNHCPNLKTWHAAAEWVGPMSQVNWTDTNVMDFFKLVEVPEADSEYQPLTDFLMDPTQ